MENKTDLISHLYSFVVNIIEKDIYGRRRIRKTRIVNVDDSKFREKQTCQGQKAQIRQLI